MLRLTGISLAAVFMSLALAASAPKAWGGTASTSPEDQTALELTIYNEDLALVKDRRSVRLGTGTQELMFMGVAAQIMPESVLFAELAPGGTLRVLEQNYEYDLLSPEKLLEKYVGREVGLATRNPFTDVEETRTATVLAHNQGTVFRMGGEVTFDYPGRLVFPSVPEDLIARPTLLWLLDNLGGAEAKGIEASYLTAGLSWRADYVLTLSADDRTADLAGWVTIENKSGAAYRDTALKLVAGAVHRAREAGLADAVRFMKAEAALPQFQEEGFFEYHLYTLERRTTLKDNQTKQIALLGASGVGVVKEYVIEGRPHYYTSRLEGSLPDAAVDVFIGIENRDKNNLGMPLPGGILRVYKRDAGGGLQFAGEDRIGHIPRDERVRVRLGRAFDLAVERRQLAWSRVHATAFESSYEVRVRNRKDEDATVLVREPVHGDWKVLRSTHPPKRLDAGTVEFQLPVKAGAEAVLEYAVRVTY